MLCFRKQGRDQLSAKSSPFTVPGTLKVHRPPRQLPFFGHVLLTPQHLGSPSSKDKGQRPRPSSPYEPPQPPLTCWPPSRPLSLPGPRWGGHTSLSLRIFPHLDKGSPRLPRPLHPPRQPRRPALCGGGPSLPTTSLRPESTCLHRARAGASRWSPTLPRVPWQPEPPAYPTQNLPFPWGAVGSGTTLSLATLPQLIPASGPLHCFLSPHHFSFPEPQQGSDRRTGSRSGCPCESQLTRGL